MGSKAADLDPDTFAALHERLGKIPLSRIRAKPAPGTAREEDLLQARKNGTGLVCELVDGVLIEKAMGTREALLGGIIVHLLWNYLETNKLGKALPGDAWLRLTQGLVRVPDVAFVAWGRLPGGKFPTAPIASLVPDLAVEVLSKGNTPKEIRRKLREYFLAGTQLVWVIDPRKKTAKVYHAAEEAVPVDATGTLDGEEVLPGFRLSLPDLFSRADEGPPA